jgi:rsbT co-antagonist protein RsbR
VRFAILDLTGVGEMDVSTVEHIERLAKAVNLLGAEIVMSGLGPKVARVMVDQGLSFQGTTMKNLREALRYCLQRRRKEPQ